MTKRRDKSDETEAEQAAQEQAETDPAVALAARNAAVRRVMAAFESALPSGAHSSGHHFAPEDGAVHDAIPDGKYRVIGSDWAGRFEGGRLVEAFRCVPPHFGGDDIEIVH